MKQRFLLPTFLTLILSIHAYAQEFQEGILRYKILNKECVEVIGTKKKITEFIIPETANYNGKTYKVIAIGNSAFKERTIDKIELPNSLKYIGYGAFSNANIKSIVIPEGVDSIASDAFSYLRPGKKEYGSRTYPNGGLEEVVLPNSLRIIGRSAFHNTKIKHVTIPNGVKIIEDDAFSSSSLQSVEFPPSLKKVGNHAFSYCYELSNIKFSEGLQSIGSSAFSYIVEP